MLDALSQRPLEPADLALVCAWWQTPQELFFAAPRLAFPATPETLQASIEGRQNPTVVQRDSGPGAFACLYDVQPGETAWIGRVVVAPALRGQGVGAYLIRLMVSQAREQYQARTVRLGCFADNIPGLRLYTALGFRPYDAVERPDWLGRRTFSIHLQLALA
jgi:RimJ/RimL family protein N-acetyltransferase